MGGLITRRPRAKTSASSARSSSKFCVTSTSPPSHTASASSITFASATTWFVRTMRWAWLLPPVAIAPVRSRFPFPEHLPPVEYPPGLEVRKVQAEGWFSYRGRDFRVSKALRGFPVALRQADRSDSRREIRFCHQVVAFIDLNHPLHAYS